METLRGWAALANSLADRLAEALSEGRTPSLDPWPFPPGFGAAGAGLGAAPATLIVEALDDDRVRRDVARIIAREIRDMENRGGF